MLSSKAGLGAALLRTPGYRADEVVLEKAVDGILDIIGLRADQHSRARGLPYGHLRRLGIGSPWSRTRSFC